MESRRRVDDVLGLTSSRRACKGQRFDAEALQAGTRNRHVFSNASLMFGSTKMVPVKSYNDFSRPLVEKRVAYMISQGPFFHFRHHEITYGEALSAQRGR